MELNNKNQHPTMSFVVSNVLPTIIKRGNGPGYFNIQVNSCIMPTPSFARVICKSKAMHVSNKVHVLYCRCNKDACQKSIYYYNFEAWIMPSAFCAGILLATAMLTVLLYKTGIIRYVHKYRLNHQVCVRRPPSSSHTQKQLKAIKSNQKQSKAIKSNQKQLKAIKSNP